MNTRFKRNPSSPLVIIVLIILAMLTSPVIAQDATREPDTSGVIVDAPAATADAPVVINVNTPATSEETPTAPETPIFSLSNIISFLIGGVVTAAGLIGWLGTQARTALNDPAKMVLAEKVGNSVPQETANKLIDGLTDVVAFLKEATDRQPALLKPTPGTSPVNLPTSGAATTHPDAG